IEYTHAIVPVGLSCRTLPTRSAECLLEPHILRDAGAERSPRVWARATGRGQAQRQPATNGSRSRVLVDRPDLSRPQLPGTRELRFVHQRRLRSLRAVEESDLTDLHGL